MNRNRINRVIKRDGSVVDFDRTKIFNAIFKAMMSVGRTDTKLVEKATNNVVEILEKNFSEDEIPTVEQIQDIVEITLIKLGEATVAKEYILYRKERERIREEKKLILNKEVLDEVDKVFDINGLRVLASRYLMKNLKNEIIESPKQLFNRCALNIAIGDILHDARIYDKEKKQVRREIMEKEEFEEIAVQEYLSRGIGIGKYKFNLYHIHTLIRTYKLLNLEGCMKMDFSEIISDFEAGEFDEYEKEVDEYYNLMVSKKFMPNTPALANFGNVHGMGSACFVLGIDDSIDSIMTTLKDAAMIFKSGGGCGYNFSKLRPAGDVVKSTCGIASGPISFITLYDKMTEVISQGGIRRGANMGVLNVEHPDIEAFIKAKEGNLMLKNFNISVLLSSEFWECYNEKKPFPLRNPRSNEVVSQIEPVYLLNTIAYEARNFAEPGVLFKDNINKHNPMLNALGAIECTNPCGEVLLYPNESCNLGSINVFEFVRTNPNTKEKSVDWDELADAVRIATRFLDNINDVNNFPFDKIREMTRKTRKIGLGVMGIADMLFELGINYASEEGLNFMENLMEFINFHSKLESIRLAQERGPFPMFKESFYPEARMPCEGFYHREKWKQDWNSVIEGIKKHGIRNAFTTVIAPTGSISMIVDASSGIEPLFSLVFEKRVVIGSFYYVNKIFERELKKIGLYSPQILERISENGGSLNGLKEFSEDMKRIFVTAAEISPEMHVRAQAAFQMWVDSSISKTINMPANATVEDVKNAYILAHKLGCKGITVYRNGSLEHQVLITGQKKKAQFKPLTEDVERIETRKEEKICPICGTELATAEGCESCLNCGWSKCAV